jgi:hypothetical protein
VPGEVPGSSLKRSITGLLGDRLKAPPAGLYATCNGDDDCKTGLECKSDRCHPTAIDMGFSGSDYVTVTPINGNTIFVDSHFHATVPNSLSTSDDDMSVVLDLDFYLTKSCDNGDIKMTISDEELEVVEARFLSTAGIVLNALSFRQLEVLAIAVSKLFVDAGGFGDSFTGLERNLGYCPSMSFSAATPPSLDFSFPGIYYCYP